MLPSTCGVVRVDDVKKQYALMGINIIGQTKGDTLYFDAELPAGWHIKATDNIWWSEVIDNKGRKRAGVYCKEMCGTGDTFIKFFARYDFYANFNEQDKENMSWVVTDNATELVVFETEKMSTDSNERDYWVLRDKLTGQCLDFLAKNYPNHEDINAYWD